jgi:hypothetical protein
LDAVSFITNNAILDGTYISGHMELKLGQEQLIVGLYVYIR